MINRKMRNIASVKTANPKDPLPNAKHEAVLQYWLAHPELTHKQVCTHFNHRDSYLSKLQGQPEFKARYEYLKKKLYKNQEKNSIWTAEQLFQKLQDRISKTKSDNTYVLGIGMLGKWSGLDKQIISLQQVQDTSFNVNINIVKREDKKDA